MQIIGTQTKYTSIRKIDRITPYYILKETIDGVEVEVYQPTNWRMILNGDNKPYLELLTVTYLVDYASSPLVEFRRNLAKDDSGQWYRLQRDCSKSASWQRTIRKLRPRTYEKLLSNNIV